MSRKKSVEEHIRNGTYRPYRHGPRPAPVPAPEPEPDEECWMADLFVNHACDGHCEEYGQQIDAAVTGKK